MRAANTLVQLLLVTVLLLVVNALADYLPGRIDLTEEKRYTLAASTARIVESVDDPVYIEVLLEGQFPAGFQRLRDAVEELLIDLGDINGEIEYAFSDPADGNVDEVNENRERLRRLGVTPVNFRVQAAEGSSERLLFPYALINYKNQRTVVNLLENDVPGQSPEVALNNSVSLLEYKIGNAIQKLLRTRRPVIGYVTGHGELSELQTRDLSRTLAPYYDIARFSLDTMPPFGPEAIGALLVAKPQRTFSERELFILDQYIMRGGRVVWMLDRLQVNLDSLQGRSNFIPRDYELGVEQLLFRYGVRVEPNLVLDLQSTPVPIVVGQVGNAPQFERRPWPYHVLATPNPSHPITRSLQPVNLFFPSEIDTTVRTKLPLKRTALLTSSPNALVRFSPVRVDLETARYDLDRELFTKSGVPLAVLLEGRFTSPYENRLGSGFAEALDQIGQSYRATSEPTKMIVIADGDVAKNLADPANDAFKPLGYNRFADYVFDNKPFLVNALEYLFDDGGIIEARNREIKLRLLDTPRAQAEAGYWRLLNVGLPLVLLVVVGLAYRYLRRRRYARV